MSDLLHINRKSADKHAMRVSQTEATAVSTADVLEFVRLYSRFILFCACLGMIMAVTYLALAQPTYRASTQILIDPGTLLDTPRIFSETAVALDTPQIESQIALIMSEQITQKVATKLGLDKLVKTSESGKSSSWWPTRSVSPSKQVKSAADPEQLALHSAAMEVKSNMEVRRVAVSHAIEVAYYAPDPVTAAEVANAISEIYLEDQMETRSRASKASGVWFEARIDELRRLMNEASSDVQQFRARRDYRIVERSAEGEMKAAQPEQVPKRGDSTTLVELESRAETYRRLYESYLQAYTETVQRGSYPGATARIISYAVPPNHKNSPRTLLVLAGAIAMSTLLGIALSLLQLAFLGPRRPQQ